MAVNHWLTSMMNLTFTTGGATSNRRFTCALVDGAPWRRHPRGHPMLSSQPSTNGALDRSTPPDCKDQLKGGVFVGGDPADENG